MLPRNLTLLLFLAVAFPMQACRSQATVVSQRPAEVAAADSTFVRLVRSLSEPGGYFDTDNLVSNEQSYLHVIGKLRDLGLEGGAYLGVGPDQNFSYIAEIQPDIAFLIDIRRDNLLQHLWFKALFALAENRAQYLALMFGKPTPLDDTWTRAPLARILDLVEQAPANEEVQSGIRRAVQETIGRFGVPLSDADRAGIERIHSEFIAAGPSLRFTSHNRPPRAYYPTYRQLVLERDLHGRASSYLASEEAFRIVKDLQQRNRIIPVVGDLAGDHALRAIGAYLTDHDVRVSAFYTSNVEFYLMRAGTFDEFAANVETLPLDEHAVIIRSYFGGWYRRRHPQAVAGYFSTQLLQPVEEFLAAHRDGGFVSYFDLVTRGTLDLR